MVSRDPLPLSAPNDSTAHVGRVRSKKAPAYGWCRCLFHAFAAVILAQVFTAAVMFAMDAIGRYIFFVLAVYGLTMAVEAQGRHISGEGSAKEWKIPALLLSVADSDVRSSLWLLGSIGLFVGSSVWFNPAPDLWPTWMEPTIERLGYVIVEVVVAVLFSLLIILPLILLRYAIDLSVMFILTRRIAATLRAVRIYRSNDSPPKWRDRGALLLVVLGRAMLVIFVGWVAPKSEHRLVGTDNMEWWDTVFCYGTFVFLGIGKFLVRVGQFVSSLAEKKNYRRGPVIVTNAGQEEAVVIVRIE